MCKYCLHETISVVGANHSHTSINSQLSGHFHECQKYLHLLYFLYLCLRNTHLCFREEGREKGGKLGKEIRNDNSAERIYRQERRTNTMEIQSCTAYLNIIDIGGFTSESRKLLQGGIRNCGRR